MILFYRILAHPLYLKCNRFNVSFTFLQLQFNEKLISRSSQDENWLLWVYDEHDDISAKLRG